MTIALYPGSFDPFHLGHLAVVRSVAPIFDEVIVAAVHNPQKTSFMFPLAERQELIRQSCEGIDNVSVAEFSGLVVDAAAELGAQVIVKGLRSSVDFELEQQMAHLNAAMSGVLSVFVPSDPEHSFVASKFVREIANLGGDVSSMVPAPVAAAIAARMG